MARTKKIEEEVEIKQEEKIDILDSILSEKAYKGLHHGSQSGEEVNSFNIISTGSFLLDGVLGGGYRSSSWSRFYAPEEHGKTSQGLSWGREWQKYWKGKNKKGFVLVFNAEGRITLDLVKRSGIDYSKEYFRIINTNNADFIYTLIERLTLNNEEDVKYFVIIDSTDACIRSVDIGKGFDEAEKIGGTATILSSAGKRLSLLFAVNEHHLYLTSQIRETLTKGKGASGGNAPKFYSSLTGRINPHWSDFSILENPSEKKSKELGRLVQLKLEKTYNETTGTTVLIPVKYGNIGGVWKEYEAYLTSLDWQLLKNTGPGRFEFTDQFCESLTENGISFEKKFHGLKNVISCLENNPDLPDFIFNEVRKIRGF